MNLALLPRLVLLIAGTGIMFFYFPLNRRKIKARTIKTKLDDFVPFIPVFVIPYLGIYTAMMAISMSMTLLLPFEFGLRFIGTIILAQCASYIFYLIYPTAVEEYVVHGNSIFDRTVRYIFSHDNRINAFPSLHVANSVICAYYLSRWFPQFLILVWICALLVIMSTILIRQHHVADIPAGIAVAVTGIEITGLLFT